MRGLIIALGLLGLHSAVLSASELPAAGTASLVAGSVTATSASGASRQLRKDDAVHTGERISTGSAAYVRLGFVDGSVMVLRPNSEFLVERFQFQPGAAVQVVPPQAGDAASTGLRVEPQPTVGNQALFRLVRGGFRAVSGLIGRINREEYAVLTPVATIGIRGTVYLAVVCDAVCAADAGVSGVLPAGQQALGGLVSAVEQGGIALSSASGQGAVVNPTQFMLTTASGQHIALPGLPGFLSGEQWLAGLQQAALAAPSAEPSVNPLLETVLSTTPAVGSLAVTVLLGAAVLASDTQDAGTTTTPTTGTTTTTTSTR